MMPVNISKLAEHFVYKSKYIDIAQDMLREFIRFHRIQLSSDLRQALDIVKSYLHDFSIESKIYHISSSTIREFFNAFGWELEDARLELLGPDISTSFTSDDTKLLAVVHSPSGISSGEITLMKKDQDLSGKIVLITEDHRVNYLKAIEKGASGAIFARKTADTSAYPYFGLFISKDLLETKGIPAVTIPWSYAERIIKAIKRGEKISAIIEVKARFTEEKIPVLVAIVGDGEPNVMGFAHSCHPAPSAHDNGSGITALFLSLLYLRDVSLVHGIKGSLTAIFAPEYSGSLAYILKYWDSIRTMGVVNLDMVGSTSINDPIKISRGWIRTPSYVEPSFYVAMKILENIPGSRISKRGFQVTSYSSGSDHDVFNFYAVPSFHVFQGIDPYYHTSHDRLENVDMLLVRDVAIALTLANVISRDNTVKSLCKHYYGCVILDSLKHSFNNVEIYNKLLSEGKIRDTPIENYSPQENVTENPLLDNPLTINVLLEKYGPDTYNALLTHFERRELSNLLFYVPGHMRSGFNVEEIAKIGGIDLGISKKEVLTLLEILNIV